MDTDPKIEPPAPPEREALDTALELFARLDAGARTGQWGPYLALVHEDVTWFAPVEGFQGLHRGKASLAKLFEHHTGATRTTWILKNIVANANEIGIEARCEGEIDGKRYANQLLMLWVVEDGKIRHMREYAGFINGVGDLSGVGAVESGRDTFAYKGR